MFRTSKFGALIRYFYELYFLGREKNGQNVFYIGGADTLPTPLDAAEEQAILHEYYESSNESSKDALRNVLIERNLRLVVFIAKKFENTGIGLEDLISIGTLGLIKAIGTFCPEKNIKLATYASRCIENEILMYIRKYSRRRKEVSIDEPLSVDWDGGELLLSDILGDEEESVSGEMERDADRKIIATAISGLSDREQLIIRLRFGLSTEENDTIRGRGKEKTQKEVADMLGISQSYISRLEKKIIRTLKAQLSQTI